MILDVNEVCANFDSTLATFIHNVIIVIKVAVPIILVLLGMLDLGKGVIASKEDEIKKGQHTFIKRLLAGAIVFFMITIVQLVISVIDRDSNGDFWTCANAIMNGKAGYSKTQDYNQEQIIKDNPSTFKYCCESLNGTIKNNDCIGTDGKKISSDEILSCANNIENNIRTKHNDKAHLCCALNGGSFSNNACKDRNGGTISNEKIDGCIVEKIKETETELYKNCCESNQGHYSNGNCVDSNGGSIADVTVNSCVLSQYK